MYIPYWLLPDALYTNYLLPIAYGWGHGALLLLLLLSCLCCCCQRLRLKEEELPLKPDLLGIGQDEDQHIGHRQEAIRPMTNRQ